MLIFFRMCFNFSEFTIIFSEFASTFSEFALNYSELCQIFSTFVLIVSEILHFFQNFLKLKKKNCYSISRTRSNFSEFPQIFLKNSVLFFYKIVSNCFRNHLCFFQNLFQLFWKFVIIFLEFVIIVSVEVQRQGNKDTSTICITRTCWFPSRERVTVLGIFVELVLPTMSSCDVFDKI